MRDYVVPVSTCTMLLLLLWAPSANRAQNSSTPICYCDDVATPCTNNTCSTLNFANRCLVDFNLDTGITRRVCTLLGLTCFFNSKGRHRGQCCDSTGCNKCLMPPNLTYEQCLQVTFPSDCPPANCSHLIEPGRVEPPTSNEATDQTLLLWGICIIIIILAIMLLLVIPTIVYYFYVFRRNSPNNKCETNLQIKSVSFVSESGNSCVSSGGRSEGVLRILEPKTIAKEIKLIELIASGGFSQLWKGTRIGATVAVKIYKSIDDHDQSFERERCIYTRSFLNHESIAIYYGADLHTPPLFPTEFWLIMRYCEHGCLANHLIHNTLSQKKVLRILCSIADALEYLHHPFKSFFGRNHEGIAHRDIKTSNILLKDEFGSCVVADFGLSLGAEDLIPGSAPVKVQVGTKQYMAPEVLNNSVLTTEIQSFCVTDIYCYGLVMWEVLRRSEGEGEPSQYAVPYHNLLPSDPTIELMREVVVEQRVRPQLEERWNVHYQNIVRLMQECWSASPDGRPTVARIRLKLAENLIS